MAGMALRAHRRRQICAFALGLSFSASVIQPGEAQTTPTQLVSAGQNLAQQKMGQSITNFCPSQNNLVNPTPGESALAMLCKNLGGIPGQGRPCR